MGKVLIGLSIVVAIGLVAFPLVAQSLGPRPEPPRLVSMEQSAQAMQQAGSLMQSHGQEMLAEGQRTGDADVTAYGRTWLRDGEQLVQGGKWMAMNPTAPGSLVSTPSELAGQGNWSLLTRGAQAMVHDPRRVSNVDLEALAWDGMAMRSEGQLMSEHGRLMSAQIDAMTAKEVLPAQTIADLRTAARTMQDVGARLEQNGQVMVEYARTLHG
ncbi:MAG: hypothetical protein KGJ86_08385 [Chloroflexota bacterium]|nr:hypothetical protein [Chloroflexota bacterium]